MYIEVHFRTHTHQDTYKNYFVFPQQKLRPGELPDEKKVNIKTRYTIAEMTILTPLQITLIKSLISVN
jgi:hypothetical protein